MRSASPVRLQTQSHLRRVFYAGLVAALVGLIFSHLTAASPASLRPGGVADQRHGGSNVADAEEASAASGAESAGSSQAGKGDARCLRYGAMKEVREARAAGTLCKLVSERARGFALARETGAPSLSPPPAAAAAQAGCRWLGDGAGRRGALGERDAATGLREGVTIVIPTYKGHETMRNTVGTWRQSGFLMHPEVTDVIVRMNGCTCRDFETMHDDIWSFAKKAPYNLNVTVL
eukprot:Rhum_TRINITY_DN14304_c4_g1::Rhum_TRINITY_DN14304_c4_g1_i1::g.79767::m.79767